MADPEDTPTVTGPGARYTPAQPYTVHADAPDPTSGPAATSAPAPDATSSPGPSPGPTPGPSPEPSSGPTPGPSPEPSRGPSPEPSSGPSSGPSRRGPDPVTLPAGLAALLVAALAMTGLLVDTDPRWVLAGGAVLVGGLVLLTSLRRT